MTIESHDTSPSKEPATEDVKRLYHQACFAYGQEDRAELSAMLLAAVAPWCCSPREATTMALDQVAAELDVLRAALAAPEEAGGPPAPEQVSAMLDGISQRARAAAELGRRIARGNLAPAADESEVQS